MPVIRIKEGEPSVPLEKAVTLRDFITNTRDVDKALILMRKMCLGGRDEVCAAYKAQVEHYLRSLLRMRSPGERGPVSEMLRRMGEPEYGAVRDVEDLWSRAEKEYPDLVEEEGRAGPEFLEEELVSGWEKRLSGMVGPDRWSRVEDIYLGVKEKVLPKPPEAEVEELEEIISAEEALLKSMRVELEEKMKRLKGAG